MNYLLHVRYTDTGRRLTLGFPSAFLRALHMVMLTPQPVVLTTEDR